MHKARLFIGAVPALLSLSALAGCGGGSGPANTAALPAPTAAPAPIATATGTAAATATATAEPVAAPEVPALLLHPVARIHSLIDVAETGGTVEVRIGTDPGGGMLGTYRYAPIVNGAVDLAQETGEILSANTASDFSFQIAGKRPDLFRHMAAGFRSVAVDSYFALDRSRDWKLVSMPAASGIGTGIFPWSQDRLLEWRLPGQAGQPFSAEEVPRLLPDLRVVRGKDKEAPSLPAAMKTRLLKEGFYLQTLTVFKTGEVVAVGTLATSDTQIGTLIWKDDPKKPDYLASEVGKAPKDAAQSEPQILGGDSLASVRLRYGDQVLKLDGATWTAESKIDDKGLPDVWFGAPRVMSGPAGMFARMAAGTPWRPVAAKVEADTEPVMLPAGDQAFAVDASGVIWTALDEQLLSSKAPTSAPIEITEEDLLKRRKGGKGKR